MYSRICPLAQSETDDNDAKITYDIRSLYIGTALMVLGKRAEPVPASWNPNLLRKAR